MIDNQTLFDQMLPPIYQQNNASIMRTNYPGYFTATDAPRRHGAASDVQSRCWTCCTLISFLIDFSMSFYLRFIHLIEFG